MIFNLKSFDDMGKYSLGSAKEYWNTDLDHIFVDNEEVTISKIEDLFPFLWSNAGGTASVKAGVYNHYFYNPRNTYWWDRYERERQEYFIREAKTFIRRHGRLDEPFKTYFHHFSAEEYAFFKKVYNIVKEKPYSKYIVIPEDIKTRCYQNTMAKLAVIKQKLIDDNKEG